MGEAMIRWQTQKVTAIQGKYSITIERQSWDGRYVGAIDIWDDHKGYQRFGGFSSITIESAQAVAKELVRLMEVTDET